MTAAAKRQPAKIIAFPKPDPIFALIQEWRDALANERRLARELDDLEGDLLSRWWALGKPGCDPTNTQAYIKPHGCVEALFTFKEVDDWVDLQKFGLLSLCLGDTKLVGKIEKEKRNTKRQLRNDLRLARIEHARARKASGHAQAHRISEEADQVCSDAMRKLCETKPTTIAGLAAMLAALQGEMEEGAYIGHYTDGRTDRLHKTLVAASATLAAKAGNAR